jgi:hypothetical protein
MGWKSADGTDRTLLLLATELLLSIALVGWDLGVHLSPPTLRWFETVDSALCELFIYHFCAVDCQVGTRCVDL